jgi:hypothetical protein
MNWISGHLEGTIISPEGKGTPYFSPNLSFEEAQMAVSKLKEMFKDSQLDILYFPEPVSMH